MKVVFHVNEREKLEGAFANVKNLLRYVREGNGQCQAELIANGKAVVLFKSEHMQESDSKNLFQELVDAGVIMAVCQNSLDGLKIRKEDLMPGVQVVASGVATLAEKQIEGYAYIKP